MRVYQRMAGHKDWEHKTPSSKDQHQSQLTPSKWVNKRQKVHNADGTTSYVDAQHQAQPSEQDVADTCALHLDREFKTNEDEYLNSGIPAPVTSGYHTATFAPASERTVV